MLIFSLSFYCHDFLGQKTEQMYEIVIPSLYLLSGVCVYASFNHLTTGLQRPLNLMHIVFAAMVIVTVAFAYTEVLMLKATNIGLLVTALKEKFDPRHCPGCGNSDAVRSP